MFPAADASLRYDATARAGNPGGRSAPLRRKHLRGCPRGARSQPSHGPRRSEARMAVRSTRFHWWPALSTANAPPLRRTPRALVTPAGCARRRRDRGATPEFWVKGLPPKNGA